MDPTQTQGVGPGNIRPDPLQDSPIQATNLPTPAPLPEASVQTQLAGRAKALTEEADVLEFIRQVEQQYPQEVALLMPEIRERFPEVARQIDQESLEALDALDQELDFELAEAVEKATAPLEEASLDELLEALRSGETDSPPEVVSEAAIQELENLSLQEQENKERREATSFVESMFKKAQHTPLTPQEISSLKAIAVKYGFIPENKLSQLDALAEPFETKPKDVNPKEANPKEVIPQEVNPQADRERALEEAWSHLPSHPETKMQKLKDTKRRVADFVEEKWIESREARARPKRLYNEVVQYVQDRIEGFRANKRRRVEESVQEERFFSLPEGFEVDNATLEGTPSYMVVLKCKKEPDESLREALAKELLPGKDAVFVRVVDDQDQIHKLVVLVKKGISEEDLRVISDHERHLIKIDEGNYDMFRMDISPNTS